jgi:predicted hydrocarbon binding protein
MISVFLSKLLTSRQANFTEESISIFDLMFSMQPLESLVDLQKSVEDNLGKKGTDLMYDFGKKISSALIDHFKTRFKLKGEQIREVWINMFSLSGFGKLEVVKFSPSSAVFQTNSSSIAKIYSEKYKRAKGPVCSIISGMLEIYFQEMTGKNIKCKETSCMAMGKQFCTFEIS